jgi:pilus assembly protein CpaB
MARTRGCIWLAAGVAVALLAAIVAYVTLTRAAQRQEAAAGGIGGTAVTVVAASQAMPVNTLIGTDMIQLRQLPVESVPEGAVGELTAAVGKITLTEVVPGEVLLAQRLADPNVVAADGRTALVIAGDKVLLAFPATDLLSKAGVLKAGDHVDLLFSLGFPTDRALGVAGAANANEEEQATWDVLQNVVIAQIVSPTVQEGDPAGEPTSVLVTVSPQDAITLKYVKDAGGVLDYVLRAPGVEQEYPTVPVDVDLLINKYRIPAEVGR